MCIQTSELQFVVNLLAQILKLLAQIYHDFFHKIINLSDYTSVETLHFGRTLLIQLNKFFFKMFWPIESSMLVLLSFGQN
jgi:hypothetical protein